MPDNQLATVSSEVKKFFEENINAGLEEQGAGVVLPMLKLTSGMSENNILANGESSKVGMLYHTGLKKEYPVLGAYILYIKKCRLPSFSNKTLMKLNYIIGGFIKDEQVPFVAFIKGMSLSPFWDYQKEMNTLVTTNHIPMFAQLVSISSEKREASVNGKAKKIDVFVLKLARNNGKPVFTQDIDLLKAFKSGIDKVKDSINLMIQQVDGVEVDDEYVDQQNRSNNLRTKDMPHTKAPEPLFGTDPDVQTPEPEGVDTTPTDVTNDLPF